MAPRTLDVFFQAKGFETQDVVSFRVERRLGLMTEAIVAVRHTEPVDPDELLAQPAYLGFGRESAEHEVFGIVMDVDIDATPEDDDERTMVTRLRMTSLMGLLEQEFDCRIFQDKDVKEIVTDVLKAAGIDDSHQSWRITGTYPKRTYCVQYNESSLAFVARLLGEEGIYFRSGGGEKGEIIIFEDDSTASDPIEGKKTIAYRFGAGLTGIEDAIGVISLRHSTATGKVTLRDYDFEKPKADLTVSAAADVDADIEIYDYPGIYTLPKEGERLARVRLEALQCAREVVEVESGCPRLLPGMWYELVDAPIEVDGEYFITGVVHELRNGVYLARATTIPKKTKYRSPRRAPAPIIQGPQTAVIVAPENSPPEEIHTDKYGRCKVKFHWDRYGKNDDSASCWMRVTQPQTSGAIVLPRVGWEVIVEFLEGNPDRPIITGRVFNGKWMPPYALPEGKSRTSLQTKSSPGGGGMNEIRFEDKAGGEEIRIKSQKDTTLATANNKKRAIAVNETKHVEKDSTLEVGADQKVQITKGYLNTVVGSQSQDIGVDRKVEVNAVIGLTVVGNSKSTITGDQMEMDGNPIEALLSLAIKAASEKAKAEAEKALGKLDDYVSSKVNQALGPVNALQSQIQDLGSAMDSFGQGNLGAAPKAFSAAAGLPSPGTMATQLSNAMELPPLPSTSKTLGLDKAANQAIDDAANALGNALGLDGAGGGGSSGANVAGPDGAVDGNTGEDKTKGPGHAINVCSATHDEKVGGLKFTAAVAGIHTTVKEARTQDVGKARLELVRRNRVETCLANKTEKALGLLVKTGSTESETVGASRTTMVGGAIYDKIGKSHEITAGSKALFVGAFHKIDAQVSIVFKCGGSEVIIDGGGITIKSDLVTITGKNIIEKNNLSQL